MTQGCFRYLDLSLDPVVYISVVHGSSGSFVPSFFIDMGCRGRESTPVQPSGLWMQATRERLEQHRAIRQDAASGVTEDVFVELGTRPRKAIASGEPVAPDEQPEYRTTEEVMAMVHRGGQEGLHPSGFRRIGTLCTFVGDLCRSSGSLMEASS